MPEISTWGMVLTPFSSGATEVDHDSLAAHVTALVDQGVTGLVALAVIAEPDALSTTERAAVLDTVLDAAAGRPVVATVMALAAPDVQHELRHVIGPRTSRLAGLMLPVHSPDPRAVTARLDAAHRRTGLPVWVQDYPGPTGVHIDLDDLLVALGSSPAVAGVKCEAAPTFVRIHRLATVLPHMQLLSGLGGANLVEDLHAGATGLACGITRPADLVAAARAWGAGDAAGTRSAVTRISSRVGIETQPGTSIAIRKEHWRRAGVIAHADVRPPQQPYPTFLSSLSATVVDLG
jgi:4-hydroxy-tetrahydrodipicolinate synthase